MCTSPLSSSSLCSYILSAYSFMSFSFFMATWLYYKPDKGLSFHISFYLLVSKLNLFTFPFFKIVFCLFFSCIPIRIFLQGFWIFEPESLCFWSKHLACWAISPEKCMYLFLSLYSVRVHITIGVPCRQNIVLFLYIVPFYIIEVFDQITFNVAILFWAVLHLRCSCLSLLLSSSVSCQVFFPWGPICGFLCLFVVFRCCSHHQAYI